MTIVNGHAQTAAMKVMVCAFAPVQVDVGDAMLDPVVQGADG